MFHGTLTRYLTDHASKDIVTLRISLPVTHQPSLLSFKNAAINLAIFFSFTDYHTLDRDRENAASGE